MSDIHIKIYAVLVLVVVTAVLMLYKEIQAITFDHAFAESLGLKTKLIESLFFALTVLAIVIGIRSVGVVLMSAMLIAPSAAARQFTNKLYIMFLLAGFFGALSGFLGNVLSMELTQYYSEKFPAERLSFPTGPMIVLVASAVCLLSLFFAPERGIFIRILRIGKFRYKCTCENILKTMWRLGDTAQVSVQDIAQYQNASNLYLRIMLAGLCRNGWIEKISSETYTLTHDGKLWAAKIVRLHRLWEVYLADYLGVGAERVHRSAEEMEHIITPEIERELTLLLHDPKEDPHNQPIPPREEL